MRLAQGIKDSINSLERVAGFLRENEQYGDVWIEDIHTIENIVAELEQEHKDTLEGDFWLHGPVSEIKVAAGKNWL